MRELTAEQTQQLESVIEDGVRYLILREGENVERIYRLRNPSHKQTDMATQMSHKYTWELRKDKNIKSRAEVEEEHKEILEDLKKRSRVVKDKLDQAQVAFIDSLPSMPDGEKDPDAFEKAVGDQSKEIEEVESEALEIQMALMEIYALSREHLVTKHKIAVLCALCWEKQTEDGEWENVWESYEAFADDRDAKALVLETETLQTLMPSAGFFGDWPLLVGGGSGT